MKNSTAIVVIVVTALTGYVALAAYALKKAI